MSETTGRRRADGRPADKPADKPGGRANEPKEPAADEPKEPNETAAQETTEPKEPAADEPKEPSETAAQETTEPKEPAADEPKEPNETAAQETTEPKETAETKEAAAQVKTEAAEEAAPNRPYAGPARSAPSPDADLPDFTTIEDDVELRESANWLREELVATRIDRDEHLDHLRRIKAEFDNYRKRMLREQSDVVARASKSLVDALLPALDSLDLTVEHAAEAEGDGDPNPLLSGVRAVRTQIYDILDKEGLERLDPDSGMPFDPAVHEPVMHKPGEGGVQTVGKVLRPGYRMKGKLLRPAMVEVTD